MINLLRLPVRCTQTGGRDSGSKFHGKILSRSGTALFAPARYDLPKSEFGVRDAWKRAQSLREPRGLFFEGNSLLSRRSSILVFSAGMGETCLEYYR